jgi:hypothetical protein
MARLAHRILGKPVAFELSMLNVEKPPLDFVEVASRLGNLVDQPVWLSRAATFVEKSSVFPRATFVVGADTVERIADPEYYRTGPDVAAAIARLHERKCRFLVFGRVIDGCFRRLSDLKLPEALRTLCQEVPAEDFRDDISSTALRRRGKA